MLLLVKHNVQTSQMNDIYNCVSAIIKMPQGTCGLEETKRLIN